MSQCDPNKHREIRRLQDDLHRLGYRKHGFDLLLPGERPRPPRIVIEELCDASDRWMRDFWDWYERRAGR